MRTISVGSGATEEKSTRRSNNTFNENVCRAYFWPSVIDGNKDPTKRRLQGEIELRGQLKPSFMFPRFTLSVRTSSGFISHARFDSWCVYSTMSVFTPSRQQAFPHLRPQTNPSSFTVSRWLPRTRLVLNHTHMHHLDMSELNKQTTITPSDTLRTETRDFIIITDSRGALKTVSSRTRSHPQSNRYLYLRILYEI